MRVLAPLPALHAVGAAVKKESHFILFSPEIFAVLVVALAVFVVVVTTRQKPSQRSADRCSDICAGMGGYVHHVDPYKGDTYCHCMRSFRVAPDGVGVQELVP